MTFPIYHLTSSASDRCPCVDVTGKAIAFFLQNSPFLERLEVIRNYRIGQLVISGPKLALKYLQIKTCFYFWDLSISNISLVSQDIQQSTPHLALTNLPMLVELSISPGMYYSPHALSKASLSQVFSCYSQLEALSLSAVFLKDITTLSNFNQPSKLKRLVIEFGSSYGDSLTPLIPIINSCPCLEEFVLMVTWNGHWVSDIMDAVLGPSISSSSLNLKSESLKVFEFKCYFGHYIDIELLKEIVDYAVCIEKIIIDPCHIIVERIPSKATKDTRRQQERAKSNALIQFTLLRKYIAPSSHVDLLLILDHLDKFQATIASRIF